MFGCYSNIKGKFSKKYSKIFFSEAVWGMKLKFSIHAYDISLYKGSVTGYGKLTWKFAHAWNFMKLCALIVLVITAVKMVYSLVNSIPLANYDVKYDVTSIAEGTPL